MNCLYFSDFWRFSNFKHGNCYTFNAKDPEKNKTLIANRGGTETGKFIQKGFFQFRDFKTVLQVLLFKFIWDKILGYISPNH